MQLSQQKKRLSNTITTFPPPLINKAANSAKMFILSIKVNKYKKLFFSFLFNPIYPGLFWLVTAKVHKVPPPPPPHHNFFCYWDLANLLSVSSST